uniref:Lysosomal acid phosphatase n=1 Tax=Macrostomum lignano TaxID=282301 RepID=A0A1I8F388_9PLAT
MDGVQMQLYDDPLHPGSQPSLMRPHRQYLLGGAQPGSLTRLGQADMIRLGQRLRRDYRQLVNDNLRKHKEDYGGWLYCRSTSILRCVQSLQCVLAGLLLDAQPGESLEASTGSRIYFAGSVAKLCPTLDRLCALELLTEEMGPCEIWEEALPYCIGTWVHTLASNVDRLASGRGDHHRFELYSSHDSMLLPVLLALGFDPRSDISWPPFGVPQSCATASQERIWCRVLYQDRAVQLPGCQSEFAPLSVLSDRFFRLARPREGFVEASQAAGRELNSWYREHGLAHLEPWPYDADSTGLMESEMPRELELL